MEEWHTLTHDVELLEHPETPVFKDGQVPSEAELHEILRQRRMERQPELAAQLDEIANWLYNLLGKKGEKDVKGIVRAINNRCNDWFKVLQRRWPQHKDRHWFCGSTPSIQANDVSLHHRASHEHSRNDYQEGHKTIRR